ncbi:MAG TPA: hypothetical protein VK705_00100 [Ferruginibacter sp.]|jgi:hypothetical protein|nr:hypothetical protein [Ferruginibacter sp.]
MRKGIYKLLLAFAGLFINVVAFAQYQTDTTKTLVTTTTTDDVMRSNNKIYVVMAVCLTILVALILYLIRIDRKITKLENLNK